MLGITPSVVYLQEGVAGYLALTTPICTSTELLLTARGACGTLSKQAMRVVDSTFSAGTCLSGKARADVQRRRRHLQAGRLWPRAARRQRRGANSSPGRLVRPPRSCTLAARGRTGITTRLLRHSSYSCMCMCAHAAQPTRSACRPVKQDSPARQDLRRFSAPAIRRRLTCARIFITLTSAHAHRSGTPQYRAPELHLDSTVVSAATDVYSIGTTIWHLVTGRLPEAGGVLQVRLLPRVL